MKIKYIIKRSRIIRIIKKKKASVNIFLNINFI